MMNAKDSYDIKLVDFGFAEPINHQELVSKAGTPGYIPSEIFKLHPYTDKGDVFSVGVIFYSVIFLYNILVNFWNILFQGQKLLGSFGG